MERDIKKISGNIVDVLNGVVYPGTLRIFGSRIVDIVRDGGRYGTYLIPGLTDAHVHVESSMLTPSEFARVATIHGTVATVSDPHEIANVLGAEGVKYMIEDGSQAPVRLYFGAPSCVPATTFETSGAYIGVEEVEELIKVKEIKYLGEVMNYPGVINNDFLVMEKIRIAQKYGKPIDGHAPGLRGEDLKKYVKTGISTDHESYNIEEALEKIKLGMKIQIREGSAAKNFEELIPLVDDYYKNCMFCSDDKHPDDLIEGQINNLVKRALNYGFDIMKVLRVASVNPVLFYGLDVGLLRIGDFADFVEIDNPKEFNVLRTFIKGVVVAQNGRSLIPRKASKIANNFNSERKKISDFFLPYKQGDLRVIEVIDGQIVTGIVIVQPKEDEGNVVSDTERDILKMVVVNRYKEAPVITSFVKNFGLKKGAIASSIAHDSHNIVAVGVTDEDITRAVNLIVDSKGGICAVSDDLKEILYLPVAGIMSVDDYKTVANKYREIDTLTRSLGSGLKSPFMTLSFMSLLVIPELKLSDKGLFDSKKFEFTNLFTD